MEIYKEFIPKTRELIAKLVSKLSHLKENFGLDAEADQPAERYVHWPEVMMGFCFASALQIATLWSQLQANLAPIFYVVSFAILLSFASIFVSKYIVSKFHRTALVLEQLGVLFAVTAFFVAVTISFPKPLVITTWIVYTISLIVIVVCNFFY